MPPNINIQQILEQINAHTILNYILTKKPNYRIIIYIYGNKKKGKSPLITPRGRLPLKFLAPFFFPFCFRIQKTRARNTIAATSTEPKTMPMTAPTVKPLWPLDFSLSEACVLLCEPDPEWWRLWDPLGGGEVTVGGRGAGRFSKEFPSYLVNI